jgi:hypothetical protein
MAQERRRPVDEILTPGSGTARARQFSTFPRERAPRGTEWMFRAATSQLPREPQLRSCGEVRIERDDRRLIDFEHHNRQGRKSSPGCVSRSERAIQNCVRERT